jgi:hypothetical protein
MGLELPTQGAPGAGVWDDVLDSNSQKTDAHDHSAGKGAPVQTAGIDINADLTFDSLYAPVNLHRITFASIVALSSSNKSLFVNTADNELYWRSNAGVNVKLTSGSTLNVAAFVGGIGGDYAAVSAALNFDDANNRYTHRGAAGTNWARIASGDLRLFETGTTDTVFVGLAAPAALGGSYTLTMPTALPVSTLLMQMSSGGVITTSNSLASALAVTGAISSTSTISAGGTISTTGSLTVDGNSTLGNAVGDTCAVSGPLTVGAALTATGLLTANGGVTTASFTLTGGDTVKHPARTISIGCAAFAPLSTNTLLESFVAGSAGGAASGGTYVGFRFGTSGSLLAAIPLRSGDRITSAIANLVTSAGSTVSTTISLQNQGAISLATFTGIRSATGAGVSLSGMQAAISAGNTTINAGDAYSVLVSCSDGGNAMHLVSVDITYDRP